MAKAQKKASGSQDYSTRKSIFDWVNSKYGDGSIMVLGDQTWRYATYRYFRIENESNKFRLHVYGYEGNAGDYVTKNNQTYLYYSNVLII